MKKLLPSLASGGYLSRDQARNAMHQLLHQSTSDAQLAAFLSILALRGIETEELCGFREALLDLAKPLDCGSYALIDLCGTGGDGKHTFNISTLSAFIMAAAGIKVAKHGNYASSSICGSSDLLEALGVPLPDNQDAARLCLEKTGIVFLHAPFWHPAMKRAAAVRKDLGFRTVFNLLGPLVNPARPTSQFCGVYSSKVQELYAAVLRDAKLRFGLVHSLDGYDEVSLTGRLRFISNEGETFLEPADFGSDTLRPEVLSCPNEIGQIPEFSLALLKCPPQDPRGLVLAANAALAIRVASPGLSLEDALDRAKEALYSGAAYRVFEILKGLSK